MNNNSKIDKSVAIFGAGIVGLNSAILLADLGFKVYLIEKRPFLGGNAAHLYKAFPTDDCFFCLLSTGFKAGIRKCFYRSGINYHQNIIIFNNSELINYTKEGDTFTLYLKKNPVYINQDCINCGKCIDICPKINNIIDIFNKNSKSPIIAYNYPQCITQFYTINRTICEDNCKECENICPTKAINLNETDIQIEIKCSKIIISPGFQEFDPSIIKNYKFGILKDVITQDQLALLLDLNGPTNGNLIRPSNKKKVQTIVILQCVGSRDENYNRYCSKICCNYAIKQAKYIKENYNPAPKIFIVYIDIRTMGFLEKYYTDARYLDINFIKGNLTDVELFKDEKSGDNKLKLRVFDAILNSILEIKSDLLVLSSGIIPSKTGTELCKKFKLELNDEGFVDTKDDGLSTNIEGIFACGSITSPMDLVNSVTSIKNMVFKIYNDFMEIGGD
ncbi:MAG: FAD-dependent oxidoreductase [Candidatus Helarchaeota archaeon]